MDFDSQSQSIEDKLREVSRVDDKMERKTMLGIMESLMERAEKVGVNLKLFLKKGKDMRHCLSQMAVRRFAEDSEIHFLIGKIEDDERLVRDLRVELLQAQERISQNKTKLKNTKFWNEKNTSMIPVYRDAKAYVEAKVGDFVSKSLFEIRKIMCCETKQDVEQIATKDLAFAVYEMFFIRGYSLHDMFPPGLEFSFDEDRDINWYKQQIVTMLRFDEKLEVEAMCNNDDVDDPPDNDAESDVELDALLNPTPEEMKFMCDMCSDDEDDDDDEEEYVRPAKRVKTDHDPVADTSGAVLLRSDKDDEKGDRAIDDGSAKDNKSDPVTVDNKSTEQEEDTKPAAS